MQDIINEISEHLKAIFKLPLTPDGYYVVNSNAAKKISQCVANFAKVYENCDAEVFKYLSDLPDRLFKPQREIFFGTYTGDYVVNSLLLGYLDATVDFSKSALFQKRAMLKAPKIFISHSSYDFEYIKAFVEMLEKIGVKQEHLFCSSIPGYNIPLNGNIYDFLRDQFEEFDLYVIMMLSKNYYKSSACLNEMGAAWVLKAEYQAILLPGFIYKHVNGAIDPRKINFSLSNVKERASRLTEVKNGIIDLLGINNIDEIIWERHKTEFTDKVDNITTSLINK